MSVDQHKMSTDITGRKQAYKELQRAEDITHSKLCDTHSQLLIRQKMPEAQKNMPSRKSQIGRWICIREFGIQVALNTLVSEQSPSFVI